MSLTSEFSGLDRVRQEVVDCLMEEDGGREINMEAVMSSNLWLDQFAPLC